MSVNFFKQQRRVINVMVENSFFLSRINPQSAPTDSREILSFASMSDEEVIALTGLQMEPAQDQRLSELLYNQQAGILSDTEYPQLWALMQVYQEKLLLKAQALREAVQRGLREPLDV